MIRIPIMLSNISKNAKRCGATASRLIAIQSQQHCGAVSAESFKFHENGGSSSSGFAYFAAAAGIATAFVANTYSQIHCDSDDKNASLPVYTRAEVAKHKDLKNGGVWVTYKDGVYDITEFISGHPGGASKILLAAGSSIDPFWKLYQQHQAKDVYDILEPMRIGNIDNSDVDLSATASADDPYGNEPPRHPILKINTQNPFNAEVPLDLLMENPITPNDLFFIRNHLPVPDINPAEYRLDIVIEGSPEQDTPPRILSLSLDDLKKRFPKYTVVSTLQCAGNRRAEMNVIKRVKGLEWTGGAISTAQWGGARLRDVLVAAGLDCEAEVGGGGGAGARPGGFEHVQFEGLDAGPDTNYGASIPIKKALDQRGDVLLAYEMNGEPIPRDHGFPVRSVVPGVVGARNVKWLGRVRVSAEESANHWQQCDYKGFSPSTDWDTVDFSQSLAIQDLPVTSAITTPSRGATIYVPPPPPQTAAKGGKKLDDKKEAEEKGEKVDEGEGLEVVGYAWSGGGRGILRVDVSLDGGNTWHIAPCDPPPVPTPPLLPPTATTGSTPPVEGAKDRGMPPIALPSPPPPPLGSGRNWAWRRFKVTLPARLVWETVTKQQQQQQEQEQEQVEQKRQGNQGAEGGGRSYELEVVCKAVDDQYNVQPEQVGGIWNLRGVLVNNWHRVRVRVTDKDIEEEEEE